MRNFKKLDFFIPERKFLFCDSCLDGLDKAHPTHDLGTKTRPVNTMIQWLLS